MTVPPFTPTDPQVIAGVGPYAIQHGYDAGSIRALVQDGEIVAVLDQGDFTVDPPASATGGTLVLAAGVAAGFDGRTLLIARDTVPLQGWQGQSSAREAALGLQLDTMTRAVQDLRQGALSAEELAAAVAAGQQAAQGAQSALAATEALAAAVADQAVFGLPVGGIIQFFGPALPAGFLPTDIDLGDGEGVVPMEDYMELFNAVGFAGGKPGGMPLGTILNSNSDFTAGDFPPASEVERPDGFIAGGLFFNGPTSGTAVVKGPAVVVAPTNQGDAATTRYVRLVVDAVTGSGTRRLVAQDAASQTVSQIGGAGEYVLVLPPGMSLGLQQLGTDDPMPTMTISAFEVRTLGSFRLPARVAGNVIRTRLTL